MGSRFKKGSQNGALSSYSQNLGSALSLQKARIAEHTARVEAEQANKMKSAFIANMSHELRTPLNAILGFSKILKKAESTDFAPEQIVEFSSYIHEAADHLLDVVNSILNISKIESGTTMLDVQDVSICEILRSAIRFIELKAKDNNITLHEEYESDLAILRGDPVRLKQIYTNLLSNAVKFTPSGGSISICVASFENKKLMVTIGDTGIGMNQAEIEVAISPFGQVDNKLSREQEGTGLGLAIAKGLIEQHGGKLEISSARGKGTVVATILPVEASEQKQKLSEKVAA
ncbi:MAG: HAMP domain-containing histidine kinase [bacterium]|nr:HAMP domain-containing histidine kinase [bacterium]